MRKLKKAAYCLVFKAAAMMKRNDGFGLNELLGTAAALILAAFIIIPGLKDFAEDVMQALGTWWNSTVVSSIFPTS